ncbi:hypothetical protein J4206_05730 [Candidatus Woesearchaeota archaeon]|nr:hypothetical protein [Candidatus Woesearchaeota archaeon]
MTATNISTLPTLPPLVFILAEDTDPHQVKSELERLAAEKEAQSPVKPYTFQLATYPPLIPNPILSATIDRNTLQDLFNATARYNPKTKAWSFEKKPAIPEGYQKKILGIGFDDILNEYITLVGFPD